MSTLLSDDPLAVEVCQAIRGGDVERLRRLLMQERSSRGYAHSGGKPAGNPQGGGREMAIHAADPLDVVVGWMDAMRRGAIDEVEHWLDPDVTWRGVRDAAVCRNRAEVLDMLQGSLEGRLGATAVEVIAGDGVAVLGAKLPGLAEIGGVDVRGQVFNVFRVGCGRIIAVEDYALRDEALAAACAEPPQWA
jgi:limonene-1,2-epoxide hydrolase